MLGKSIFKILYTENIINVKKQNTFMHALHEHMNLMKREQNMLFSVNI